MTAAALAFFLSRLFFLTAIALPMLLLLSNEGVVMVALVRGVVVVGGVVVAVPFGGVAVGVAVWSAVGVARRRRKVELVFFVSISDLPSNSTADGDECSTVFWVTDDLFFIIVVVVAVGGGLEAFKDEVDDKNIKGDD